jgi:hypothetical protein
LEVYGPITYTAGTGYLNIRFPIPLWEVIRSGTHGIIGHEYAGKSDKELKEIATKFVDERLKLHKDGNTWANMMGMLSYGSVELSRAKQIAQGLKHAKSFRDRLKAMQKQIDDFNAKTIKDRNDQQKAQKKSVKKKK